MAGLLAKQRGRIRDAIKHFEQSILKGYADPVDANLQLAECQIISGKIEESTRHLTTAADLKSDSSFDADIAYWKCELALQNPESFGKPLELMKQVPMDQLPPDQREFLLGMQSENSIAARDYFRASLTHNPFHHSARRSNLVMLLSLAQFDQVLQEAQISRQLYPEDNDFVLLEAMAYAAKNQLDKSVHLISQSTLDDTSKSDWNRLCERIQFVAAPSETDVATLLPELVTNFKKNFAPLIRSRRWHFPPKIAECFAALQMTADEEYEPGTGIVEVARQHPEGTLLVLAARYAISKTEMEVEDLELAKELFQQAKVKPSFATTPPVMRGSAF